MDKCREEFDLWIIENNKSISIPNFIMKDENGEYVDRQTADLWISWKASRESMKAIKLPEILGADMDGSDRVMLAHEVIEAIALAGYKVEE